MPEACALTLEEHFECVLRESVEDVLSTMFFAGVMGEVNPPGIAEQLREAAPLLWVSVAFSGSISGALHLAVPEDVAATLAADFSGCNDPSVGDQRAAEYALCELANMICGSTLSRIAPDAQVKLSHPQLSAEPLPMGVTRWFELTEGMIGLSVRID